MSTRRDLCHTGYTRSSGFCMSQCLCLWFLERLESSPPKAGFPEDQALEELAAVPVPEKENNRSPEVKLSNSLKIPFSKNKSHCGGIISALHLTTGETRIPY
ncbi:unnamed protein product [Rangifer tarandus platyrhynchus]|uniref:Uncharacterized protein n=2 Tax=Rangifer tarandus platyrhynchus TaxID=3082113 RepID=A0ABN8YXR7_RANTA|nr:unnamed protein product [Rangifer tarandus platyrhynchus]